MRTHRRLIRRPVAGIGLLIATACTSTHSSDPVTAIEGAVIVSVPMGFSVPAGVNYRQVAAASGSTLLLGDRSQLVTTTGGFADGSTSGVTKAHLGFNTKTGSITVAGSVEVMDGAAISGSIRAGQAATFGVNALADPSAANVTVTGTVQNNAVVTPLQSYGWTVPFNTSATTQTVTTGTTSLAPGSYSSVNVQGGTVTLQSGTYYIDNLTLEPAGTIAVNASAGPVLLYIRTSFVDHGTWSAASPDKVMLGYLGTTLLALEKPFSGTVVAPNSRVRLAVGGTPHRGTVFAKEVELDPDVKLTFVPFANWAAVGIDVTPRFECYQARSDGKVAAIFGYSNPTSVPVTVPIGADNKFTTGAADRGQPSAFLPGSYSRAFAVAYSSGSLSWTVNGAVASVAGLPSDPARQCPQPSVSVARDATVQSSQPTANFGTATTLTVAAGKSAVIAFDRAALKSQIGVGRVVTSATLRFNIASGPATNLEALPLSKEFTEAGVTWNCAKDLDTSASGEHCLSYERWNLVRRDRTNENPWQTHKTPTMGTVAGSTVSFDVTADLNRALGSSGNGISPSWIVVSSATTATQLRSREAGGTLVPALVIQTVPILDSDLLANPPLQFSVDTTIPVRSGALPPFVAGGPARPRSAVRGPSGRIAEFTENELMVFTDDSAQLAAVKARWNATEAIAQSVTMVGVPKMHVLNVDLTKAVPATIVANLQQLDNLPRGAHGVSSANGLALLSIAAEEARRGTRVGVNWVPKSPQLDLNAVATNSLPEGTRSGAPSNSMTWDYLNYYGVPKAWAELLVTGKAKHSRNVAIIDTGYRSGFLDTEKPTATECLDCPNSLEKGKTWHGTHVMNAGFAAPGNSFGPAGPGAPVSDLTLIYSYGSQIELALRLPFLAASEHIINTSHSIPVPASLSWTNWDADASTYVARNVYKTLIFAAAGNDGEDVDAEDCILTVCWESTWWFPCENHGVNCVGATPGVGTSGATAASIASISNRGGEVDYFGAGGVFTTEDPDKATSPPGTAIVTNGPATSWATPFVAGIAALTWAANTDKSAGDVEDCLSSTGTLETSGGDHLIVNAAKAVACAQGNPANYSPGIVITTPADGGSTAPGPLSATAFAFDLEDGILHNIVWKVNGVGAGTSDSGMSHALALSPGVATIEASVIDTFSAGASAQVTMAVTPSPPILKIIDPPANMLTFNFGLPVSFVVVQTDAVAQPSCSSFMWSGYDPLNTQIFSNRPGCQIDVSSFGVGTDRVVVTLNQNGLVGATSRTVNMVDDGKLHVRITSPARVDNLGDLVTPILGLDVGPPTKSVAFGASVVPAGGTVTYDWFATPPDGGPELIPGSGTSAVIWTPTLPSGNCVKKTYTIGVRATDSDGNVDYDSMLVKFRGPCIQP